MQEELNVSSCTAVDDLPPFKFQREFWYYLSAFLQHFPSFGGGGGGVWGGGGGFPFLLF